MALVIFFITFLSFANECPAEKVLSPLPVHDQDGVGSCASNTAALMMQHNLGLAESPSYLQLSITTSGLEKADFYFKDDKGERRLFNWGAHICEVIKVAKDDGYCRHTAFAHDSIGQADPQHEQGKFLNSIAEYLEQNRSELISLRSKLASPKERQIAQQNFAYRKFARTQTCARAFDEFISHRALTRFREVLSTQIQSSAGPEKQKLQRMYRETFDERGEPTARALEFHKGFIRSTGQQLLSEEKKEQFTLGTTSLPNEAIFSVWWGNELKIGGVKLNYPFVNMFQSDHAAFGPCRKEETLLDDFKYIQKEAFCRVPGQSSLPQNFLDQAEEILSQLQEYLSPQADPQAAIVNLVSPSCAVQMTQNKGNENLGCNNHSINNDNSAERAKEKIYSQLCLGKALAISMCTGFFKSSGPVDSEYCKNDIPGVAGHGRHALTLVGYRTYGGKKQIKIQNSWGPTCPFLQNDSNSVPSALAPLVECEMDSGNRPTGRFWVDEDLLIKNSYQLSVMP